MSVAGFMYVVVPVDEYFSDIIMNLQRTVVHLECNF